VAFVVGNRKRARLTFYVGMINHTMRTFASAIPYLKGSVVAVQLSKYIISFVRSRHRGINP